MKPPPNVNLAGVFICTVLVSTATFRSAAPARGDSFLLQTSYNSEVKDDLDNQFAKTATRVILAISTGILVVVLAIWSMFIFTAPKASDYTKEKALKRAIPELAAFAKEEGLPFQEFEGHAFIARFGLDFTTYDVCYKHNKQIFCFDDWTNRTAIWNIDSELDDDYRQEFERAFHQKLLVGN
ncbi:MAG: hypothetical protein AB7P76_10965 [Candidatus Melainabacteria bacterium]